MRTLFADRRLIPSFISRSVIFSRRATVNEKNIFVTRLELEFGTNGSIGLKTVIPLNAPAHATTLEAIVAHNDSVDEKFVAHMKTIGEYIRVFDETIAWIQEPDRRFNLASTIGFNPLFIHGTWSEKEVRIEVFARSTRELNLGFETGNSGQMIYGLQRFTDIREALAEYQQHFGEIKMSSVTKQN